MSEYMIFAQSYLKGKLLCSSSPLFNSRFPSAYPVAVTMERIQRFKLVLAQKKLTIDSYSYLNHHKMTISFKNEKYPFSSDLNKRAPMGTS